MPTLNWLTREDDIRATSRVAYRLLDEVVEYSSGEGNTGNMLVQGDNLDALKALLPFYAGRVKCIYIDPPYNTRSAFEQYDDNLEHTRWLAMIWPRLELLRELLSEDGSIWVSIDDNEAHYLKVVMDEVLGRSSFVADIVWQRTHTRENRTDIANVHDNILVYAKNRAIWREVRNPLPKSEEQLQRFKNPDGDPRGRWASRYRTRVITDGVIPSLHVDYKHSRIKQYHKEGRALRTETVINDTYDFDIGRRLCNLDVLNRTGFAANRRRLRVQRIGHDCFIGAETFDDLHRPRVVDRQRASALRFGDPRAGLSSGSRSRTATASPTTACAPPCVTTELTLVCSVR